MKSFIFDMLGRAICHIGLGNFSRAHLAAFNNAFLNKVGPCEWGICAIERDFPRSQELEAYLRANDFKYKLITKAPNGTEEEEEIIAFSDFINMGQNPEAALARLAHEGTRIVSLTITGPFYFTPSNRMISPHIVPPHGDLISLPKYMCHGCLISVFVA